MESRIQFHRIIALLHAVFPPALILSLRCFVVVFAILFMIIVVVVVCFQFPTTLGIAAPFSGRSTCELMCNRAWSCHRRYKINPFLYSLANIVGLKVGRGGLRQNTPPSSVDHASPPLKMPADPLMIVTLTCGHRCSEDDKSLPYLCVWHRKAQ